jgi:hypothetical protein
VTDPGHERPLGEAMLLDGTEAFYLCHRKLFGLAAQIKIYIRNIGDISVIRGSVNSAPSIAPLPRPKRRI